MPLAKRQSRWFLSERWISLTWRRRGTHAFDRVDHTILLHKLKRNGIQGKLLQWIKSFLTGRKQQVSVNTFLSEEAEIISGVPQGTVLGPLLFLIMIQDIDEEVKESILSCFADDTCIMKGIKCLTDTFKLQNDLNSVYRWTNSNNAKLNGKKFEHSLMVKIMILRKNQFT